MPMLHEAMASDERDKWLEAMKIEVATLVMQKTWTPVPRDKAPNVLKGMWTFKLKRLADNTPYRYKARYVVRGDLQRAGIDFFDTYVPVV